LPYTASLSLASLSLSFSFKLFFQLKDFEGRQSVARFMTTFSCWTYQRAILNFTPGPQGCISPLGVNLAPRGEICPLGVKFTPSFTPRGEHYLLFKRMEGRTENFTPRGQIHPWVTNSPLGSKFAPRGEVKNGPQNRRNLGTRMLLLLLLHCRMGLKRK
jgi:hypothetical protein